MADDDPQLLSVFEQAMRIMARWPGTVRINQVRLKDRIADVLHWTAQFTPTPYSCTYTVEFTYVAGCSIVKVQVVDPELDPGVAWDLPHVHDLGAEVWLCLHRAHEWDPSMSIAETVIPWAAEWLFHYELWLATGDWTGGGDRYTTQRRPLDGVTLR